MRPGGWRACAPRAAVLLLVCLTRATWSQSDGPGGRLEWRRDESDVYGLATRPRVSTASVKYLGDFANMFKCTAWLVTRQAIEQYQCITWFSKRSETEWAGGCYGVLRGARAFCRGAPVREAYSAMTDTTPAPPSERCSHTPPTAVAPYAQWLHLCPSRYDFEARLRASGAARRLHAVWPHTPFRAQLEAWSLPPCTPTPRVSGIRAPAGHHHHDTLPPLAIDATAAAEDAMGGVERSLGLPEGHLLDYEVDRHRRGDGSVEDVCVDEARQNGAPTTLRARRVERACLLRARLDRLRHDSPMPTRLQAQRQGLRNASTGRPRTAAVVLYGALPSAADVGGCDGLDARAGAAARAAREPLIRSAEVAADSVRRLVVGSLERAGAQTTVWMSAGVAPGDGVGERVVEAYTRVLSPRYVHRLPAPPPNQLVALIEALTPLAARRAPALRPGLIGSAWSAYELVVLCRYGVQLKAELPAAAHAAFAHALAFSFDLTRAGWRAEERSVYELRRTLRDAGRTERRAADAVHALDGRYVPCLAQLLLVQLDRGTEWEALLPALPRAAAPAAQRYAPNPAAEWRVADADSLAELPASAQQLLPELDLVRMVGGAYAGEPCAGGAAMANPLYELLPQGCARARPRWRARAPTAGRMRARAQRRSASTAVRVHYRGSRARARPRQAGTYGRQRVPGGDQLLARRAE